MKNIAAGVKAINIPIIINDSPITPEIFSELWFPPALMFLSDREVKNFLNLTKNPNSINKSAIDSMKNKKSWNFDI